MLKLSGSEDYYPTPDNLIERMLNGLDWKEVKYVLEPSAGKGNIAEYIKVLRENRYHEVDIDCIEIEPELRAILKGKGLRVVHDNFLTYHTYKHYDVIIMNPPFSSGARHLLKAIEVQSLSGGGIICILNAETIRNAYSRERQELSEKLKEYGAEIEYYEKAFAEAEHPTDVEVAVVKVIIPEPERKTRIFDTLREKEYEEYERKDVDAELAERDFVKIFVSLYNRELEWGLRLNEEYQEMQSKAMDGHGKLKLVIGEGYSDHEKFTVNGYVKAIRRKYWEKLFNHPEITKRLTSDMYYKYMSRLHEFTNYDFSYWNIKTIQEEIALSIVGEVEASILELFDKLSSRYSWDEDMPGNIHYYNGWKTNVAWKINKRVILPLRAWSYRGDLDYSPNLQNSMCTLSDIEKVLNYLDSGETRSEVEIGRSILDAQKSGQMKKIRTKYFELTFYKKGTCHITFTNDRLLKKLNIYGSQQKGWLPKGYARKRYEEFNLEEQSVIESFEGIESYNETLMESQYYIFEAVRTMPMLTSKI